MRESVPLGVYFLNVLLIFLCVHESSCSRLDYAQGSLLMEKKGNPLNPFMPSSSPREAPQPFLPLLAPSPLTPLMNNTIPILSGLCPLNFSLTEKMLRITAINCWSIFAPYLANVVCCPQLEATLVILIGKSSKETGVLALDGTHAKYCISDIEKILAVQGANDNLANICSIHPSTVTEASCPIKDVNEFESVVDSSQLLSACEKIDPVKECCSQVCENAISEAASKIALKDYGILRTDGPHMLPEHSSRIDDCKRIALRWVASKLEPSSAKEVLRGLSSCNVNKVCPLVFPDMKNVAMGCENGISNQTACCSAMDSYVSHLQKQSFITNLQALNCASLLGMKLQQANITENVYRLCHINLKDFSLQVGSQESGCLLPSLPSDATFDKSSGISFLCDLNDNIAAPWPSASLLPASPCHKKVNIPALPAATSAQSGLYAVKLICPLLFSSLLVLATLQYFS